MKLFRKFFLLGLLLVGMTAGMIFSLSSFQQVLHQMTQHTNLSAWSLAQLQLEYQQFVTSLELYDAGREKPEQVSLAYDIAWNRMDVFLHGSENEYIRARYHAGEMVTQVFNKLQRHEALIDHIPEPGDPRIKEWLKELLADQEPLREIMIRNFTGEAATQQLQKSRDLLNNTTYSLIAVLILSFWIGYFLFRESKRHWYLSQHDSLTGLLNRAQFQTDLKFRCEHQLNTGVSYQFCSIHIMSFNEINNLYGYSIGDEQLRKIGHLLLQRLGQCGGLVGRVSSSGFAIYNTQRQIEINLEPALDSIEQILETYDPAGRIRICCGVSQYPSQANDSYNLFLYAELAVQVAKSRREQRIQFFNNVIQQDFIRRRQLAIDLREQLNRRQASTLMLNYQPLVPMHPMEKFGFEALLRWQHPILGYISPLEIIDIAEEHGFAVLLGEWIFRQVLSDIQTVEEPLLNQFYVSVNLSPSLFNRQLPQKLIDMLNISNIDARHLAVEVTEDITLQNVDDSIAILNDLRKAGIQSSLDDFGTGYSSLSYIKDLPVDKLKLDKSFVRYIDLNYKQYQLANHICSLAHDLDLTVVAEGVETQEELNIMKQFQVNYVQGYFYSKPIPFTNALAFLDHHLSTQASHGA